MESYKKEFLKLKCFPPLKILTSPFIGRDSWSFLSFLSFFQYLFSSLFSMLRLLRSWGFNDHFFNNFFSNEMVLTG
jgi:hypothetical protein